MSEDTTLSHRRRAQESTEQSLNLTGPPAMPPVPEQIPGPSNRPLPEGLTPGPLLASLMHALVSDDDDHEDHPSTAAPSSSIDTTEQHFNPTTRPTIPPTLSQGAGFLSQSSSKGVTATSSAPRVIHSILSDDDDDGRDGEEDQTTFPLFAADDVRTTFASDVHRSHGDNVINVSDNYSDENFTEDESDSTASSESELVGPGHPTPPRFGHQSMRPISVGPSDQECKRAWSEVLQTEQELEEEEAQATLVSRNRERRRQELMAAKRRFVVFDRQPRRCLAKCLTLS
jgi:hypothetical protein